MDIDKLITKKQQQDIIETIKTCCLKYQKFESDAKKMFYEPYTEMRRKYSVTSAVISCFAPDRIKINGITSTDIEYGLHNKLAQPQLSTKNGIFQIYSNGSNLKGNPIIENSKLFNTDLKSYPIFFVIVFSATKDGILNSIKISIPNKDGEFIEHHTIYENSKIVSLTA